MSRIALLTLVVADYDQAIDFFAGALGFRILEDTAMEDNKRWVVVAPPGGGGASILLARAETDAERGRIGNQTGGRVFLFLETDNFSADHDRMLAAGVTFVEEPRKEAYGTVAVFEDICGNRWDLIQPTR